MSMKKRVLSGMRPTGKLHLGNYIGALKNWIDLQEKYECFYMIADFHALTTEYNNPKEIKNYITEMVIDWITVGLDPKKCSIFLQSNVKEHAELHLILSMITPISWLQRCPTYKEQQKELKNIDLSTYGFLGYPVLQAADILIYKAEFVPVGEDQLPHLELTREIVRRFNNFYKPILIEPQPLLTPITKLPGIDNRKMSKSYNNCIYISDSLSSVKEKIMNMFTDPKKIRINDIGHPQGCVVFKYHSIYNEKEVENIEKECKKGKIGCVKCKENLYQKMAPVFEIWSKKREEIIHKLDINEIIEAGSKNAREIAKKTIEEIKQAIF
jgi:tryptophanyl-tRNA synthetase